MSRREDVDNAIWQDSEFDGLSNEAQLLYLWSFTNPRCGMAGIYKVPRRQLLEGRLPEDKLTDALAELEEGRFAFYADGVLWVRSRVAHLRTKTPQIARSIQNDLAKVPATCELRGAFLHVYGEVHWLAECLDEIPHEPIAKRDHYVSDKTRAKVFARDGAACSECGAVEDLSIDHVIPVAAGGKGDEANLAVLCSSCNTRKGVSLGTTRTLLEGSNEPDRQAESRPSLEGQKTLQGKGMGKGKGNGKGKGTETSRRARAKVAGKVVTDAERTTASAILDAFNTAASSEYTLDAHLTPLVMRIRERPSLSIEVHRQVITANFANPWWDDRPGVEVIYGNKRAFERALERAKGPQPVGTKPDFSEYDKTSERFEVAA